jgi:hypothetical protein
MYVHSCMQIETGRLTETDRMSIFPQFEKLYLPILFLKTIGKVSSHLINMTKRHTCTDPVCRLSQSRTSPCLAVPVIIEWWPSDWTQYREESNGSSHCMTLCGEYWVPLYCGWESLTHGNLNLDLMTHIKKGLHMHIFKLPFYKK